MEVTGSKNAISGHPHRVFYGVLLLAAITWAALGVLAALGYPGAPSACRFSGGCWCERCGRTVLPRVTHPLVAGRGRQIGVVCLGCRRGGVLPGHALWHLGMSITVFLFGLHAITGRRALAAIESSGRLSPAQGCQIKSK